MLRKTPISPLLENTFLLRGRALKLCVGTDSSCFGGSTILGLPSSLFPHSTVEL
nr:hypothetical protein Iba_scaffold38136CG0010 [Ipomoea batatas]GMD56690.1 hypothetical protein Iba_scaffold47997CG0010 [Ipomoea batatas]GMD82447.1 hypothetical protein Iba_chr13fCG8180 [Ipomoea batatas]